MTLDDYIKIIIKKTLMDLIAYADSDNPYIVKEKTSDICGCLLFDNISTHKISIQDKINIIYAYGLEKDMIKSKKGKIDKHHLLTEFDGLIFFICEQKLIKLGYMEEDLEAA